MQFRSQLYNIFHNMNKINLKILVIFQTKKYITLHPIGEYLKVKRSLIWDLPMEYNNVMSSWDIIYNT